MKKPLALFLVTTLAAGSLALAGCSDPQPTEPSDFGTIKIVTGSHAASAYPLTLAVAAGLFEKHGIKPDVTVTGGGPLAIAAIAGGDAAFGVVPYADAMRATEGGQALISITSLTTQMTSDGVISQETADRIGLKSDMPLAEKLERAKGISIAVTARGSTQEKLIAFVLNKYTNLDAEKDFEITGIVSDGMVAALQQGVVDGFVHSAPFTTEAVNNQNGVWWFRPSQGEVPELDGFVFTAIATTQKWIDENPEMLKAAVAAIDESLQMLHNDIDGAAKAIAEYTEGKEEAVKANIELTLKAYPKRADITQEGFDKNIEFLNASGNPVNVSFNDVNNTSFLPAK